MGSMDKFLRQQRDAAAKLVAAYVELGTGRQELIEAQLRAVERVNATTGGRQARGLAAVAEVQPAFNAGETQVRGKAREIHEAAAALSENWREHEQLWDELGPLDTAVIADTRTSWTEVGQAAANAERSDREFLRSLREFASLSQAAATATMGLISAEDAIISASGEVRALADEYVDVLNRVGRRIDGGQ
jgi:hypothetical protein